jgi:hypothetical protein
VYHAGAPDALRANRVNNLELVRTSAYVPPFPVGSRFGVSSTSYTALPFVTDS